MELGSAQRHPPPVLRPDPIETDIDTAGIFGWPLVRSTTYTLIAEETLKRRKGNFSGGTKKETGISSPVPRPGRPGHYNHETPELLLNVRPASPHGRVNYLAGHIVSAGSCYAARFTGNGSSLPFAAFSGVASNW